MASAKVGSPSQSCHFSIGSRIVTRVERVAYRSSRSSSMSRRLLELCLAEAEVVEDDEVDLGEGGEQFGIGAVAAGDGDVVQQPRESQVKRGETVAAGLMGKRTAETVGVVSFASKLSLLVASTSTAGPTPVAQPKPVLDAQPQLRA